MDSGKIPLSAQEQAECWLPSNKVFVLGITNYPETFNIEEKITNLIYYETPGIFNCDNLWTQERKNCLF